MNMKRWLSVFAAVLLAGILLSCATAQGPTEAAGPSAPPTVESTAALVVAEAPTLEPTLVPTPEPTSEDMPEPTPELTPEPTPEPDPLLALLAEGGQTEGDFLAQTNAVAAVPDTAEEVVFSSASGSVLYRAEGAVRSAQVTAQPPVRITKSAQEVPEGFPELRVDYQNLKAVLTWTPVEWADGYSIYRKIESTGETVLLKKVSGSTLEYADVYRRSMIRENEQKILTAGHFIDPSINSLVYSVRAYKSDPTADAYSDYMEYFELPEPSVVSVDLGKERALIQWARVPLAEGYNLYEGYMADDGLLHWKRVAQAEQQKTQRLEMVVPWDKGCPFFTVEAYAHRNGQKVFSAHEEAFRVDLRRYGDKRILFMGDSITYGSPYLSSVKGSLIGRADYYSYPNRVAQLTGMSFYNPSIPGSTYTMNSRTNRDHIITQVADKLVYGGDMVVQTEAHQGAYHQNVHHWRYEDFDVIVLAAGTNDYLDNAPLGELDSTSIYTFSGALNTIFGYLEAANEKRIALGKAPFKVIMADLFYSDRTYEKSQRTNRFITPNRDGLTLTDYQNRLYELADKYRSRGMEIYRWETDDYVNEETCPYRSSDNLHFTKTTYGLIGYGLTMFMLEQGMLD